MFVLGFYESTVMPGILNDIFIIILNPYTDSVLFHILVKLKSIGRMFFSHMLVYSNFSTEKQRTMITFMNIRRYYSVDFSLMSFQHKEIANFLLTYVTLNSFVYEFNMGFQFSIALKSLRTRITLKFVSIFSIFIVLIYDMRS